MSKRKARRRDVVTAQPPVLTEPPVEPAPSPAARAESFGISFCVLGIVTIVVGVCLTFHWMASPSESKFLGSGDGWMYYGPVISYMDYSIHHGDFPLWNPLNFCGQPFAANPQSFLFYPPNLLRSLLTLDPTPLKTHTGIAILVVLQLLLAGMSAFFLARRHSLSYGAALLAAFGFVFSAPLVTRATGHWIFLNSVCWFPLTLLLLNLALSQKSYRRQIAFSLGAAVTWAMTILGGVPFLLLLGGMMAGLYTLLFRLLNPLDLSHETTGSAHPAAVRRWGRGAARFLTRDGTALAIVLIVGVLLAAPLLLPGYEFSQQTERAVKSEEAHEDFAPVQAGWDFLRMLVVYPGHGHYEGIRAAGAIVFMLALVALVSRPGRNVWFWGAILLVLLDCSLSKPLIFGRLLTAVAPFQMGNPGRAMIVGCIPLGLLAGLGADAVLQCPPTLPTRAYRTVMLAIAGMFVVSVVAFCARPEPVLPVGKLVIAIPAVACLLAIAAIWFPEPIVWGTMLAMLVLGETLAWNQHLIPAVVPEEGRYPQPMEQLAQRPVFWSGNQRGLEEKPNVHMYSLRGVINGYDPMHLREVRDVLCTTRENKAFRRIIYASEPKALNTRGNLFLKRQFWLARQYAEGKMPNKNECFPPTTTVFLENPGELPIPELDPAKVARTGVSPDSEEIWLKRRGDKPLALNSKDITASKKTFAFNPITIPPLHSSLSLTLSSTCPMDLNIAFADGKTGLTELGKLIRLTAQKKEETFDVPLPDVQELRIALMPDFKGSAGTLSFIEAVIRSDHNDEDKMITVLSRTPNSVEVELHDLPDHRMLLNVDAFYPGWRAYLDGKPTDIYRANEVFKAVLVPPGSHRVKFVFRPTTVVAGVVVSMCTLTAICAALFVLLRKPRPVANGA